MHFAFKPPKKNFRKARNIALLASGLIGAGYLAVHHERIIDTAVSQAQRAHAFLESSLYDGAGKHLPQRPVYR